MTECTPCPPGYECPTADGTPQLCTDGEYATGGAISCFSCPAGYACPNKSSNALQSCEPGWYSVGGKSSCTACRAGL